MTDQAFFGLRSSFILSYSVFRCLKLFINKCKAYNKLRRPLPLPSQKYTGSMTARTESYNDLLSHIKLYKVLSIFIVS